MATIRVCDRCARRIDGAAGYIEMTVTGDPPPSLRIGRRPDPRNPEVPRIEIEVCSSCWSGIAALLDVLDGTS